MGASRSAVAVPHSPRRARRPRGRARPAGSGSRPMPRSWGTGRSGAVSAAPCARWWSGDVRATAHACCVLPCVCVFAMSCFVDGRRRPEAEMAVVEERTEEEKRKQEREREEGSTRGEGGTGRQFRDKGRSRGAQRCGGTHRQYCATFANSCDCGARGRGWGIVENAPLSSCVAARRSGTSSRKSAQPDPCWR